ncbi:MAG TPA: phage tail tube protein [Mycobacterium sp.]|nr:phage tail tube protein [Mycobacterium sp.]
MSSNPVAGAEKANVVAVKETALGTPATAGGQTLQPNADGIGNYYPQLKTVTPQPLSKLGQDEKAIIVDEDAKPTLTMDLTKDATDAFGEGILLVKAKHNGGTGVAYFTNNLPTPTVTARTTSAYTVNANGALQAGTLVVPRGWATGANATANGTLQVVGASSTGTSIPVAGGVAETPSGYTVTLEAAGFRGASGDIQLNASGNLTSTVADFTTMGLVVGQAIWVGGTIGSGHDFATAAYRGFALVVAISANLLTLERRQWTVGSADTGTGKTIDIYFGRLLRTVAFTDADYQEPSYNLELTYLKLQSGTTDEYVYSNGNLVDQVDIDGTAQGLIGLTLTFLGQTIANPTTSRATYGGSAAGPLCTNRFNTVTQIPYVVLKNKADETVISDDIQTWKLSYMNHISAQKQQGFFGTKRIVVGRRSAALTATVALTSDAAMTACANNTSLTFGAGINNPDGGLFFDVPSVVCTNAPPKFPQNSWITLDLTLAGFRDATGNTTLRVTQFPYLPTV